MKRILIAAPIALAACHSSPSVTATNASMAEVSAKVASATASGQFVSPGRWESVMTIEDMTIPGIAPDMAAKMKTAMGKAKTFTSCLTPEQAAKPKADFFGGGDKSCRYDHFTMDGGKIDAAMTCSMQGMKRTMTMNGTYSPEAYHMTVASNGSGAPGSPMSGMSMKMVMDAHRNGACNGTEQH